MLDWLCFCHSKSVSTSNFNLIIEVMNVPGSSHPRLLFHTSTRTNYVYIACFDVLCVQLHILILVGVYIHVPALYMYAV